MLLLKCSHLTRYHRSLLLVLLSSAGINSLSSCSNFHHFIYKISINIRVDTSLCTLLLNKIYLTTIFIFNEFESRYFAWQAPLSRVN